MRSMNRAVQPVLGMTDCVSSRTKKTGVLVSSKMVLVASSVFESRFQVDIF